MSPQTKKNILLCLLILFGGWVNTLTPPDTLEPKAWSLFAIFLTTILSVLFKLLSILNASVLALAVSILSGILSPKIAYSGFSKDFILLIVLVFLISKAVHKSGLGKRLAFHLIKRMGRSPLGLAYATTLTDVFLAPAFPSNTARSGLLYPIFNGITRACGSHPNDSSRKKIGHYLMMNGIAGISISSTLWLTGMAANLISVNIAKQYGIHITFLSWLGAASLPAIFSIIVMPWILFKVTNPQLKETKDIHELATNELQTLGPLSSPEKIMTLTFVGMIIAWALSSQFGIDKTAVAFLGLGLLMLFNILTLKDLQQEGRALSILIWFGILYTMSSQLNELGFMAYVGSLIAAPLAGLHWILVYLGLICSYVLLHYLFVSQTAHILALFAVFLQIGVSLGVPPLLLAYMLAFMSNIFSPLTPQGSSANIVFAGSGYLHIHEIYKYGLLITTINSLIFLFVGSLWIMWLF